MCGPIPILVAQLAIAAATSLATHFSQEAQASAESSYQKRVAQAHNEAAMQNARSAIIEQTEQSASERVSQMQGQEAAAQEAFDIRQERLKAGGEAAASSQASGRAFDMLLADYKRTESMKTSVIKQQLQMQGAQHDFSVRGMRDRAESRIKSQQGYVASPISRPSWVLTGLGFGAQAVDKVSNYYDKKGDKSS